MTHDVSKEEDDAELAARLVQVARRLPPGARQVKIIALAVVFMALSDDPAGLSRHLGSGDTTD